jgi:hypothetical protein
MKNLLSKKQFVDDADADPDPAMSFFFDADPIRIRNLPVLQVIHKLEIRIYLFTFIFMVLSFSSVS